MRAISGPIGSASSGSVALQSSLESKLRARMADLGSPLFKLTWKHWVIDSQLQICALRASGHRTSGPDSGSWRSPMATDGKGGAKEIVGREDLAGTRTRVMLRDQAQMTFWPTPNTMAGGQTSRSGDRKGELLMGGLISWPTPCSQDGPKGGPGQGADRLPGAASLATWPTPQACQAPNMGTNRGKDHGGGRKRITPQSVEGLLGWGTPRSVESGHATGNPDRAMDHKSRLEDQVFLSGPIATGSPAATEKPGQLSPAHSRWLMGYPKEWDDLGDTATQLCLSLPPSSSEPPSTQ